MDKSIEIISAFPILDVLWVDWDDDVLEEFQQIHGRVEEDEWYDVVSEVSNKFEKYLSDLKRQYNNKFRYNVENDGAAIMFSNQFKSLRGYIEMINEVIDFLEVNGIPWRMNDLTFNFSNYREGGAIRFDQEDKLIKVYYVDPEPGDNEFRKVKIQMGKSRKI